MIVYKITNLYVEEEYEALRRTIQGCDHVEHLEEVAVRLFTSHYFHMPVELGLDILRRFLQVSPDKEKGKTFLGMWLHLYGMEWENDCEGIKLFEEVKDPNPPDAPWNIPFSERWVD